jgi:hypothetical protein
MGTEWHSACSCTEELFERLETDTITRVDKNVYVCDQQVALLALSLCREHVARLKTHRSSNSDSEEIGQIFTSFSFVL